MPDGHMSMTQKPPDNWRKARRRLQRRDARQKLGGWASRPVLIVLVALVVVAGGVAAISTLLTSQHIASRYCLRAFVPAYFPSGMWAQATSVRPAPRAMILNPATGLGAGTAPDPAFQAAVRHARAAGTAVLGYTSTADGQRPIAQIEADVRNYRTWYGVTGIFLDSVNGISSELPYYQQLASYIRRVIPGSQIWINPGNYPDQAYMSVGDVVMVFEGTYGQYQNIGVPAWAHHFPAARFANTVYDAPSGPQANTAIGLAQSRNAGYVYVTNLSGPNPYDALPSYWSAESTAIRARCGTSGR